MHDFHGTFRDLLHAANLQHGTHGFTSLPKEGVLRIFSPLKIWRLRPGLNPRTWVPKASTLPLDHRSRWVSLTKSVGNRPLGIPGQKNNNNRANKIRGDCVFCFHLVQTWNISQALVNTALNIQVPYKAYEELPNIRFSRRPRLQGAVSSDDNTNSFFT